MLGVLSKGCGTVFLEGRSVGLSCYIKYNASRSDFSIHLEAGRKDLDATALTWFHEYMTSRVGKIGVCGFACS